MPTRTDILNADQVSVGLTTALTFDDVLLVPQHSTILPSQVDVSTIFTRNIAPFRPFAHGDGVSSVVRRAMKRAGVVTPAKGAHVLRHTAATEMLRHGVPLDQIALVLRHRGIDTTAYYAKADVNSLKQIAQPWPEVLP